MLCVLLVVCVSADFVEREVAFLIRQHTDMVPSPDRHNHLCYGFRYRDQLGEFMFPHAGLPSVKGQNFTFNEEQCDLLLDFDVQEVDTNLAHYFGRPGCAGPKMALVDLFVVASYYKLIDWGNFSVVMPGKDWSSPLSEAEAMTFRNSRYCRVDNPGQCEDALELFGQLCAPHLTTPVQPLPSPKVSWKLPWEKYTFRT